MSGETRVVNIRKSACDVYIGRGAGGKVTALGVKGCFGNPFDVRVHGATALDKFRVYFLARVETEPRFRDEVLALRGKALGCFCKPGPCHGDVIAEWVDAQSARPAAPKGGPA